MQHGVTTAGNVTQASGWSSRQSPQSGGLRYAGGYCAGWWQVVQLPASKLAWLAGDGFSFPAP
jgi:hypothetical protein